MTTITIDNVGYAIENLYDAAKAKPVGCQFVDQEWPQLISLQFVD